MSDISKIDSNFNVASAIDEPDVKFYDINKAPFVVYGVFYEDGKFRRLPESVAKTVSNGVTHLHAKTAGGRVRFRTDSNYVAIHAELDCSAPSSHMTLTCAAGFDMYVREETEKYAGTFIPPRDIEDGYESVIHFNDSKMREITIHFPLFSDVRNLYIGLNENATVFEPTPYKLDKPVVFYGSSITQGGCASRPGNAYTNMLSLWYNVDHVNLGFAGNAKGEPEIADYVSKLDMSVFVYDYDYNARKVVGLQTTHEPMFQKVRQAHPDVPIIIMSRPKYYLTEVEKERLEVIRTTYRNAVESGDKNVYLIEGSELMELAGDIGNVDNCHPNDLGFFSMAKAVGKVLEKILEKLVGESK